jgi:hypothetical protein
LEKKIWAKEAALAVAVAVVLLWPLQVVVVAVELA